MYAERRGWPLAQVAEKTPVTFKMTAERLTGRLLGVQIVGYEGSAKRIDTAATALWNRLPPE
jgi:hypothetical protein